MASDLERLKKLVDATVAAQAGMPQAAPNAGQTMSAADEAALALAKAKLSGRT